jgi:chromosome segregation ATPase
MGEGERAEVLASVHTESIVLRCAQERLEAATARAEKAERERNELGSQLSAAELQYTRQGLLLEQARARAEAAEREVERLRLDAAQRDRDWAVIRTLTDANVGPATTVEAVRRVVSERDSLRESVAAREKERDEFRTATAVRDEQLALVRSQRDSLRTRLISAETAAAQRGPREYPLAEGSRWEGDEIVESDGMRMSYRRPFVAVYQHGDGVAMKVEARARNLAALLAKRGLL